MTMHMAVFESSNTSKAGEVPPTKIGMNALDINPYLHEFFEPIPSIKIFDDHGLSWTIVHGRKGKFGRF